MLTSHGHHIKGTPTEGENPRASRARCGGPEFCTRCRAEAALAISKLDLGEKREQD